METFSPTRRFRGPVIPNWIIGNQRLSPGAKLLYVVLASNACGHDHCWPSQSTLSTTLSVSVRSVQNYLRELISAGFIRQEILKKGGVLRYYFLKNGSVELSPLPADPPHKKDDSIVVPEYPLSAPTHASSGGYANFAGGSAQRCRANLPPSSPSAPDLSKSLRASEHSPALSDEYANPADGYANFSDPHPKVAQGYANFADNIKYNININTNPPLPPHEVKRELPSPLNPCGVVGGASALESCEKAFSRLFDAWPRKEAGTVAFRVWKSLWFSGQLPPCDKLLQQVEALKKHDRAWVRGYPPYLVNWLRDERWRDSAPEPLSAPTPTPSDVTPPDVGKDSQRSLSEKEADFERFQALYRKAYPSSRTGRQPVREQALYISQLRESYLSTDNQRSVC